MGDYFLCYLLFLLGLPFIYADCLQNTVCKPKAEEEGVCDIYRQDYGAPIPSYTVSRTCGKDGPIVTEDTNFFKLLASFTRENIPERVACTKGAGAHGYFEVTHDITEYTKAAVFSDVGKKTPVFSRFSRNKGYRAITDTKRAVLGFATKFYTSDGNWDLMTLGTQKVFFLRDPILFPSLSHSIRNPATGTFDLNAQFDFFTKRQETLSALLYLYSDGGTPYGYRHIDAHSLNAYVFVNNNNTATYVKFTWKTNQGVKNFTAEGADKAAGENPDWSIADLYTNIEAGNYPSYTLCVQLMSQEQAERVKFNPFDATTLWPEEEFPCRPAGKLLLNKNPSNYFEEVEQAGFCPSQLPPGIQPSQDRLLQGRIFVYDDAQRYRLGINSHQIPINQPKGVPCCPHNLNRDGQMNIYNQPGEPDYYPNSYSNLHPDTSAELRDYHTHGKVARHDLGNQADFKQAKYIYESFSEWDRKQLAKNVGNDIKNIDKKIQCRVLQMFRGISSHLATSIARYGDINERKNC